MKYEEVYLKAYEDAHEAKYSLGNYLRFYNARRPHQSLGYPTPVEVYAGTMEPINGGIVQSPLSTAGFHLILTSSLSN